MFAIVVWYVVQRWFCRLCRSCRGSEEVLRFSRDSAEVQVQWWCRCRATELQWCAEVCSKCAEMVHSSYRGAGDCADVQTAEVHTR